DGALGAGMNALPPVAARLGAPLLAFDRGVLTAASEPAVLPLAPLGRLMPVRQMLSVGVGDELTATGDAPAALGRAVIGFRAGLTNDGRRVVLATPARSDDYTLDARRRDLGFLVLLAALTGALAALWLSGVAARQLARPVGSLRRAAVALARGKPGLPESDPASLGRGAHRVAAALHREPPAEFRPVFGAFRHMASELDASHVALEAARRRTAAVLRDVASGVVAVDAVACVTVANPRAVALLGRPLGVGEPLDAVVPPEIAGPMRAFLADAAAVAAAEHPDGADVAFEVTIRGRQLRARLTTLGASPAVGGGPGGTDTEELGRAAAGAVLTLDDVTDLAQAQRALAWGEMARQVAHEIKNPLTPIRLGVQLLRRAYRDGRSDFGALLEANTERVLAEIDRLDEIARAFSRYGTTPAHAPAPEPADVATIARDVVALERLGAVDGAGHDAGTDGGPPVRWELDAPERATAWARDGELREVVLNLLENARLAGAHCVRVTVSHAELNGDGAGIALAVHDDGSGIAPDVLPRIFDPHFSTRTSGSGLGLAIARRLVDGWGGRISAESVVGRGTIVTVTLRAADVRV
ncbi:MAG TPA: ATP-binding protein, partial [Gemmatirosa sp.]